MARRGLRAGRCLLAIDVERRQVVDNPRHHNLSLPGKCIVGCCDTREPETGYPTDHDTGDDLAAP
jgi:hypothetical protein